MKALALFVALISLGCSSKTIYVFADSGTPPPRDFATPERDLAAPIPPPEDLHAPAPLPDLFQACTSPAPGFYTEYNSCTYTSAANPNPTTGNNTLNVIVRNDGTFERPADNTTVPAFFHCNTPPAIDMKTCMAPCCSGDPSIVPSVYYYAKGWRLFKAGTCSFKDPNSAVVYSVQFTNINGVM